MFLQLERPAQIDARLRSVEAWRMLEMFLDVEREGAPVSGHWHDVLTSGLTGIPPQVLGPLFEERVALAGPAWFRLPESVVLASVKDRAAWDGLISAVAPEGRSTEGPVEIHELAGGVRLAFDGKTALIGRPGASAELFGKCVGLLAGRPEESLARLSLFAEQVRRLPRASAGIFYFAFADPSSSPAEAFGLGPPLRAGVVGLDARGNSLDLVLRAAPAEPPSKASPRVAIARVQHLPRSTVAAWATSVNLEQLFDRWVSMLPGNTADAPSYVQLLRGAVDLDALKRNVVGLLGPRLIVCWGRGGEGDGPGSSLAVLLESADAESAKRALDAAVAQLALAVSRTYAQDDQERLRVVREEHLGTELVIVELAEFAARSEAEGLGRRLAMNMRPCYAVLDGWLMAAWRVEHMRELIAAHNGVRPVLGEFADVGGAGASRLPATSLGIVQPATAAAMVGEWLDDAQGNPDSLLNPEMWDFATETQGPGAGGGLGLGLKPRHRAGRVMVLKVYDDGPCRDVVKVGDEIVAVNGAALSLEDANGDLRRKLKGLGSEASVTLRLERRGEFMEVTVDRRPQVTLGGGLVADAVRALRRLQAVVRPLTLATFAVTQSDAKNFSAQLRVRFSEQEQARPASSGQ